MVLSRSLPSCKSNAALSTASLLRWPQLTHNQPAAPEASSAFVPANAGASLPGDLLTRPGLAPRPSQLLSAEYHPEGWHIALSEHLLRHKDTTEFVLFLVGSTGRVNACVTPGLLSREAHLLEAHRTALERSARPASSDGERSPFNANSVDNAGLHDSAIGSSRNVSIVSSRHSPLSPTWQSGVCCAYEHDSDQHGQANAALTTPTRVECDDDDDEVDVDVDADGPRKMEVNPSSPEHVYDFLKQAVSVLQEGLMKDILKRFIKVIEPKKQSKFPYQSSETKIKRGRDPRQRYPVPLVPQWWPIDLVPHKEPDHIKKEERLHLLNHLLRTWPQQMARQQGENNNPRPPADADEDEAAEWQDGWPTRFTYDWFNILEASVRECKLQQSKDSEARADRRKEVLSSLFIVVRTEFDVITGARNPEILSVNVPIKIPANPPRKTNKNRANEMSSEFAHDETAPSRSSKRTARTKDSVNKRTDQSTGSSRVRRSGFESNRHSSLFESTNQHHAPPTSLHEIVQPSQEKVSEPTIHGIPEMRAMRHTHAIDIEGQDVTSWSKGTSVFRLAPMPRRSKHKQPQRIVSKGANGTNMPPTWYGVDHRSLLRIQSGQPLNEPLEDSCFQIGGTGDLPSSTAVDAASSACLMNSSPYLEMESVEDANRSTQLAADRERTGVLGKRVYPAKDADNWSQPKYPRMTTDSSMLSFVSMDHANLFDPGYNQHWGQVAEAKMSFTHGLVDQNAMLLNAPESGLPELPSSRGSHAFSTHDLGGDLVCGNTSIPSIRGTISFTNSGLAHENPTWTTHDFGTQGVAAPHFSAPVSPRRFGLANNAYSPATAPSLCAASSICSDGISSVTV